MDVHAELFRLSPTFPDWPFEESFAVVTTANELALMAEYIRSPSNPVAPNVVFMLQTSSTVLKYKRFYYYESTLWRWVVVNTNLCIKYMFGAWVTTTTGDHVVFGRFY